MEETAAGYGIPVEKISKINGLPPDLILSNDHRLIIPLMGTQALTKTFVPLTVWPAYPGHTLSMMAAELKVPVSWLATTNNILEHQRLFPGQPVLVPNLTNPYRSDVIGKVTVEYLSPFIAAGQTGFLLLSSSPGIEPSVHLGDIKLKLTQVPQLEASHQRLFHYTPVPINPLTETGSLTLDIGYLTMDQKQVNRHLRLNVFQPKRWKQETIVVGDNVSSQLSPSVIQNEKTILEQIWSRRDLPRQWSDQPWQKPIAGQHVQTSLFGSRREYLSPVPLNLTFHSGLDFAAPLGTEVTAPLAGTVVLAADLVTKGQAIVLDHGQGVLSGYWHLSELSVAEGDFVENGELLGRVGNTGISSGPHLHWEVRIHGVPVNPLQFVYGSVLPPLDQ